MVKADFASQKIKTLLSQLAGCLVGWLAGWLFCLIHVFEHVHHFKATTSFEWFPSSGKWPISTQLASLIWKIPYFCYFFFDGFPYRK
jgi:hypothetical protein